MFSTEREVPRDSKTKQTQITKNIIPLVQSNATEKTTMYPIVLTIHQKILF